MQFSVPGPRVTFVHGRVANAKEFSENLVFGARIVATIQVAGSQAPMVKS